MAVTKTFTLNSGIVLSEQARSEGMGEEMIDPNDVRVTRVYDVDWADRVKAAAELVGWAEMRRTTAGAAYFISRHIPHAHDDYLHHTLAGGSIYGGATNHYIYAKQVKRIQGLAPDGKTIDNVGQFQRARMWVEYGTLPYVVREDSDPGMTTITADSEEIPDESAWDRYVTVRVAPQGRYFTIPPTMDSLNSFFWVGSNPAAGVSIGIPKQMPFFNVHVTWHQVPAEAIPLSLFPGSESGNNAIKTMMSTVNNATFNGFNKGTLLLTSVKFSELRYFPFGGRQFNIDFFFNHNEPESAASGHNYLFRPHDTASTADWVEITTDGTTAPVPSNATTQTDGESLYDWRDFRDLFRPTAALGP